MVDTQTVKWLKYEFSVYPFAAEVDWPEVGGIYIFAHWDPEALEWRILYVGQTEDFGTRLPNHERWQEAKEQEATHVHLLEVGQAWQRDRIEKELIAEFLPLLNVVSREPQP